jgi:bifunctional non-homologous end joining protein LigD
MLRKYRKNAHTKRSTQLLRPTIRPSSSARNSVYAFDLLHYDGKDLRDRSLIDRRALLKELLSDKASSVLQFSDEFVGDAQALLAEAE